MIELFGGGIVLDSIDLITYAVVGILAIFVFSLIIKKVFKLALIFIIITIIAYYNVPDLIASIAFP
ncbi:hypothetical protein Desdi_2756 [Desulfitobacterium dichloroeliminans LMG P-21439]|uniref:Uncharacterized protein n=1 Tax=Desulfitobacterium dichloroeliminans (strain LMG P-21439 / DCA1) TaxID=871963 RepID=L0FAX6_DESDL|nr:hypothetical protein [Desulfitobacterium dichloroeliminans]AGA70170.1 hypothetical protein Desdi_2756 [Desulfitobacterium dichloroeliminans LMG P-21439]